MYRRFLVMFLRRSIVVFALICLGCSAQSVPPDVAQRIERQVRSFYSIPAGVKISLSPLKPSEFPNYDALTITFEGDKKQNYDFLLSKDGKTLMRMAKIDLTKDPYAELMKKIDVAGRPTRGNKDAKVVAINYDDFECPYCSRMHQTLFPQLLKEYGDRVAFIYKDFPLAEIHPWAIHAAVDANCLSSQNNDAYWDFADYIHSNQTEVNSEKSREGQFGALDRLAMVQGQKHSVDGAKLQSCMKAQKDDAVKASVKEGSTLGVEATPTMFVNGEKIDGAMPISDIRAVLDRALQQAGVAPPLHAAAAASTPSQPASK
ncbi:MAG TPA: thioredoxin domain-containing protein [Terriglobales bacterium]|nr:thioredoxin domain-containing protein [Terriglobales bacterium]